MAEREEEFKDISIEDAMKELHKNRKRILLDFAKAYLAETELSPSEVHLVESHFMTPDGKIETIFEFRRKKDE